MSLVTMKEILEGSIEGKYAVGAFDTLDCVATDAILKAAEMKNTPIILMLVEANPEQEEFIQYTLDKCRKSSVPVALHLDHGPTYEEAMRAIHAGCTSVMFDGSSLPFEENVRITKEVVKVAHACGVTVEAEIGHVAGHEGNMLDGNVPDASAYTTVEETVRFYEETKVDCLAIAIGTVHGVYKGEPNLDYERLQAIRDKLPIPLVMHGGSGLRPDDFKKAIAHGINKINFYTGMTLGAGEAVRAVMKERDKVTMTNIIQIGSKAITDIVSEHIEIFGTKSL